MSTIAESRVSRSRLLVAVLGTVGGVLFLAAVVGFFVADLSWSLVVDSYGLTNSVIGVGFLSCGVLIAWNRSDNALGWLFLVCGIGHLITAAAVGPIAIGLQDHWPPEVTRSIATILGSSWQVGIAGLFPLTLLLFPDGHYPSRRWRPVGWLIIAQMIFQIGTSMLAGGSPIDSAEASSILSIGLVLPGWLSNAMNILGSALFVLVIASLFLRYRRGTEQVRSQLLWLILAVLILGVLNSQRWVTGDGPILLLLSFVLIPIAITVAVLRYQLLDIRLVVSRTLLYIIVSLIAIAVYAGLVAGVSLLLPAAANRGVAIAAALVVAFGFNPLRIRLQRVIDRAFYGSRDDPVGTATRIGAQLDSDDSLDGVLERARDALRLRALSVQRDGRPVASAGPQLPDGLLVTIPLSYQGVSVGVLCVGLRRGENVLHQADQRVLTLLATPLAITLHSVDLAEQIQASRSAIVSAREEERVRLHRELHDGLGPLLTGAAFRADAVHNVLRTEPDRADILLSQVRAEIRQALGDVRRTVYGLRPLELEELGLIGAVRQRVNVASNGDGDPLVVRVDAPEELPHLSPAVEVAAYRIAVEAVTNVARHSGGGNCVVRLRAGDLLTIEVTDDGRTGGAAWKAGVGIRSIVERAEELGGCASAIPTETGGRVFAQLPLTGRGFQDVAR